VRIARRPSLCVNGEANGKHSAWVIANQGHAYWARFGCDPFTETAFLEKPLKRVNDRVAPPVALLAGVP
jgi:hypothetical protein